jgi:hypothetical protein
MTAREPSLSFERGAAPRISAGRRRVELAAVWCAAAGLAGTAPACAEYIAQNHDALPPLGWVALVTQAITFVVAAGAIIGAAIGAALSLRVRAIARLALAVVLGTLACAGLGALGANHFGVLELPYFGGPAILGSIGLSVLMAAVGFARIEAAIAGRGAVWRAALAPAPVILLVAAAALAIAPSVAGLDLDTMRELTDDLGLAEVGALGGTIVGSLCATWFAASALLTR